MCMQCDTWDGVHAHSFMRSQSAGRPHASCVESRPWGGCGVPMGCTDEAACQQQCVDMSLCGAVFVPYFFQHGPDLKWHHSMGGADAL